MTDLSTERIRWLLVQLKGEGQVPQTDNRQDGSLETLVEPEHESEPFDADTIQFLVQPPGGADSEILALKPDLSDAAEVVTEAVREGYWIHGRGFFNALRSAIKGPLANAYQGSQEPLRQISFQDEIKIMEFANSAISNQEAEIEKAIKEVQSSAAAYAINKLAASKEEIISTTIRYIDGVENRGKAIKWLTDGSRYFEFKNEAGIDLVKGLFSIWGAHLALEKKDRVLAERMKHAGAEMQKITAQRWEFLRNKDRDNTPSSSDTYFSKNYGVRLLKATNAKRPELEAQAIEKFPDPPTVTEARADTLEAAAAVAATLVDEGSEHPILYRIWNPSLASVLYSRFNRPGIKVADMKLFSPVLQLRLATWQALSSSYEAAIDLSETIAKSPSQLWRFPLLIEAALEEMDLSDDAFIRVAAEHHIDQLTEEAEASRRFFRSASEVLMAASVAIKFTPAPPQFTLPANIVITAIDTIVGGIGLLTEYLQEAETRAAFRAFLVPGESFATSDGSYLGVIVGAAFLLFGVAGLNRTTLTKADKAEAALVAGAIIHQEYSALKSDVEGGEQP